MLLKRRAPVPLIALLDANARLGSVISDSVGGVGEETQCERGALLHDWMVEYGMCAPATFNEAHNGNQATWHPPTKTARATRNDYALTPIQWKGYLMGTSTLMVESLGDSLDHEAAAFRVAFSSREKRRGLAGPQKAVRPKPIA